MTINELIAVINGSTQHKSLYHFTDEANFPLISQHGLLSKEQLRVRRLWPPPATGGNDLSRQLDLVRVYQGAKLFEKCGPSPEIFGYEPREAKKYIRALECGRFVGFVLEGRRYPLIPKNAFYDWLYIRALARHT
jgi:hypothetical protein